MNYELLKVASDDDWRAYHAIRRKVLWEDRGRTTYDETHEDEYLSNAYPLLLKLSGHPIGTTRLDDFGNGTGVVRLVAVISDAQGKGHGRMLSKLVEDRAKELGIHTLLVNAARTAVGYYEKMGWKVHSWNQQELQGIAADCVQMKKEIA